MWMHSIRYSNGDDTVEVYKNIEDEYTLDIFPTEAEDDLGSHQTISLPATALDELVRELRQMGWISE